MQRKLLMTAAAALLVAAGATMSTGGALAQGAAPNLSGTYKCQPEPVSCQASGQTFTIQQNGNKLDMKSDKGDTAQGQMSSNTTMSVGAPWNMLGVVEPGNSIQWSNGTQWIKQ
jgi:hypothetical protein